MNKNILIHLFSAAAICFMLFSLTTTVGNRLFWEDRQTRKHERWDHTHRQHEHRESLKKYKEHHEEAIRNYENAED